MRRASVLVLVVEDDLWLRTLAGDALREAGYQVVEASNGYSGLRLARERRPEAVVRVHLRLPELPGLELLRSPSGDGPSQAIVVVSGAPDLLTPDLRGGVAAVVAKPFDVGDLVGAVDAALCTARSRSLGRPTGPAAERLAPAVRASRRARRRTAWQRRKIARVR